MINIYKSDNTNYNNNGNATLVPIYCTQKVNINGVWQVVMEHPYDKEERWKFIVAGAVLKIHTTAVETTTNDQLYRIYSVETGLHSVYCEALPIALDAYNDTNVNSLVIDDKTGTQFASTLNDLWNKYTITSNISAKNSGKYQNTNLIEILNGGDKCFSKLWKGEIKYDNTAISVNTRLDSNPATYKLRLGRDIKDIKYKVDETDVITRIYPVGTSGARLNYQEDYQINDGKQYVDSALINDYPIIHKTYAKTDYLICTSKSDSKDQDAYNDTASFLGDVSARVSRHYLDALNNFMSDSIPTTRGSIEFVKEILKLTAKKDGVSGLVELLKDSITYLKNEELLKFINQTIDGSASFISEYEDSEYELTLLGWNFTQIVTDPTTPNHGIYIKKTRDCEGVVIACIPDGYATIKKVEGIPYINETTPDDPKKIWEGTETDEVLVMLDLDEYVDIKISYTLSGESTTKTVTTDRSSIVFDNYKYVLQNPQFTGQGEYATEEWVNINNRWRYFNANGYMTPATDPDPWGWWDDDSKKYYGNVKKGIKVRSQWLKVDGRWTWFDSDGKAHHRKEMIGVVSGIFNLQLQADFMTSLVAGEQHLYEQFYQRLTEYALDMYSKGADLPTITVDVDAMVLNNVVGYEGFATLKLGNGVHVDFGDLEADERVIGIEYDCVTNRNSKIILGAPSDTITSMINRKADVGSGYVGGYGIKIENNLITYSGGEGEGVGGGGSGASDISVLPKATEGTPVADIVVDDQTYHLYGGLQYWIEEKIEHSFQSASGIEYRYDYKIRHDVDWQAGRDAGELGWVSDNNVAYEHTPDDRPISGSNWDAKVFEGAGTYDDNYDAFKAFGHCLIVCYETPYYDTPPHTSFHVMLIGQQLSDINDAIGRHHNGFMHDDLDTGFLIQDFRVNAPDVDEGQYWYVAEQSCIYSKTTEHHKTPFPYLGMFPADVDKQALAQYVVDDAHPVAPDELADGRVFTILENSNWEGYLMYGGFNYKRPSEEDYGIQNFPFKVSNNGTVTCKGLVLNGVNISNVIQDVTINGFTTVNRAYKTSEINLGSGLSYNRDTKTISADFTGYTAGDNIDITNNVISATYDVFGEEDGLVPAPSEGDEEKFLKADGTWAEVKINNARTIAWKNITPTQYEALSSAEKNNGVIYLVSENAQGASGFFTAWKSVTTAPSTADNILYLESENANGAMSMEITPTDKIPTENDNNLYFVGG